MDSKNQIQNREIKFRGKRTDNGEWVYGYFFKSWDNCYILHGTVNGVPVMVEVIPETIGQLTGLKDANGDDIYEGDIVETFSKSRYECQYGLYSGIMLFKSIADARDSYFLAELHDPVVIGNIHENEELLTQNKD